MIENDKIIRDGKEICQYFNEYFATITDSLDIPKFPTPPIQHAGDIICDAIPIYATHPRVLKIKGRAINNERFKFSYVDPPLVFSEINKIDPSKKTSGAVPTDKPILASNACYRESTYHIDNAISTNMFPEIFKLADVTPLLKKGENSNMGDFCPISVLSSLSKFYERVLSQQILPFIIPATSSHETC